jgi:DNA-binding transcriptional ArsR family regulator
MSESDLVEFVRYSIGSIWNLELLLHLRRSGDRAWAADELVRELRASQSVVNEGLRTLRTAGLIVSEGEGEWRYAPASPAMDQMTRDLEVLYRERPIAVSQALFARGNEKLQSFADAFRLRKD